MRPATTRDLETLAYLKAFAETWGRLPTYRAARERLGWASSNSVFEAMRRLEARGYLERVTPPGMGEIWRLTGKA